VCVCVCIYIYIYIYIKALNMRINVNDESGKLQKEAVATYYEVLTHDLPGGTAQSLKGQPSPRQRF
jgi:hypothetical protein